MTKVGNLRTCDKLILNWHPVFCIRNWNFHDKPASFPTQTHTFADRHSVHHHGAAVCHGDAHPGRNPGHPVYAEKRFGSPDRRTVPAHARIDHRTKSPERFLSCSILLLAHQFAIPMVLMVSTTPAAAIILFMGH